MVNLTRWTSLKNHVSFTGCPKNIIRMTYFSVIFCHISGLVVSLTVALNSLFRQKTCFMVNLTCWTALKNHVSFTGCSKNIQKKIYFRVISCHFLDLLWAKWRPLKRDFRRQIFCMVHLTQGTVVKLIFSFTGCPKKILNRLVSSSYFVIFAVDCEHNWKDKNGTLEDILSTWSTLHAGQCLNLIFDSQGVPKRLNLFLFFILIRHISRSIVKITKASKTNW